MKAWRLVAYGDFEKGIKMLNIEKPSPKPNEVLIECKAAALNPVDYKFAEGQLKMFYKQPMPAGLAFDCSGVVSEVGEDVTHLEVGDEVFCCSPTDSPGSIAEFFCVEADVVLPKPNNLTFEEAAAMPLVGLTALTCLEKVNLQKGQSILIHAGSGGVGSFAIQYAKSIGAKVYSTTGSSNVDWVKELGADVVIDYKTQNYLEVVPKVDAVFDTLGDPYTKDAFKILKPGGSVVSIAGRKLDDETARGMGFNLILRWFLKLQLVGINKLCKKYQAQYFYVLNQPEQKRLARLKSALETQVVKPVIDTIYPFDKVVEAFKKQQSGRCKGKVVIRISI